VGFSLARVGTIAGNTFTESVRQKVYLVLLILGLVVLASASFFAQFTFSEQIKFVKDFCLGVLSVFGTLIAIVGTAQLLPAELENRTIYTTLAKPVRRLEFLLGKYLGSVMMVLLTVLVMSLLIGMVVLLMEHRMAGHTIEDAAGQLTPELREQLAQMRAEAFDPDLVKAVALVAVKLMLLAAITLLFSTFSTSMVFNVVMAFLAFFAGHLRTTAADVWAGNKALVFLLAIVPDLGAFNVADDIILGNAIPWAHVNEIAVYGLVRIVIVVAAAHFIFSKREI
jgi:ABC-type Na+ efflux pump permease subunit